MARIIRRGGVFYYRAKVPKAIRDILRRGELTFSLHTSSAAIAEERALAMSAAQLRLCRAVRQAGPMSADEIDKLVTHYMTSFQSNREEDSIMSGSLSPVAGAERRSWAADELTAAEDDLLHNRLSATERLARDLLRETGHALRLMADIGAGVKTFSVNWVFRFIATADRDPRKIYSTVPAQNWKSP